MNTDATKSQENASSDDEDTASYHDTSDTTSFKIEEYDKDAAANDNELITSFPTTTAVVVDVPLVNFTNATTGNIRHTNNRTAIFSADGKLSEQSQNPYVVPPVCSRDQSQSSPSSDSYNTASTPTVADTAGIVVERVEKAGQSMQKAKPITLLQLSKAEQLQIDSNAASVSEDNLSCSIATTTTDMDVENAASVSPMKAGVLTLRSAKDHLPNIRQDQFLMPDDSNFASPSHVRPLSLATSQQNRSLPPVKALQPKLCVYNWMRRLCLSFKSSGIGEPSVYHALVVIFLEFFAWGLLTMPIITVLNQTFPDHTFLMNGLVMGIKGILSFLSAPLIGALSDIWGRKFFLLITVFFTCAPIPLMAINAWWFFAMISISGAFAVTFSVVFAYVADVTTVEERSRAYGLVSATFAASLVISPALGAVLRELYSDTLVAALATAIAVLDVFFILVAVPESLPEKIRPSSWVAPISWEQADPFSALRKVGTDHTVLMQCVTVFFSYLPEAGQYSCIFVYLKLKMGFHAMEVAIFIAVVGILSIAVQVTLGYLMRALGAKNTIILGLILEMLQLLWYGFGSQAWMMWSAGILAALASITYPAISAFVSIHSNPDRQGAVQGMVTGMRGLCNGLGPAMFGVIFYLFNVDLNDDRLKTLPKNPVAGVQNETNETNEKYIQLIPGPPFVFGAFMVILAILVAIYIPASPVEANLSKTPSEKKRVSVDVQFEVEYGQKLASPLSPLMRSDSLAQL